MSIYRTSIMLVLLGISSLSYGAGSSRDAFSGFYFGSDFGYRWGNSNYEVDFGNVHNTKVSNDMPERTGFGSLFIGYGHLFDNNFYLGSELEGSFYPTDGQLWESHTDRKYGERVYARYGYNVSILPGYAVTKDILLYSRFGAGQTRYTNKSYEDDQKVRDVSAWSNIEYRMGAGIAYKLTEHLSIRSEYNYITGARFDSNNFTGRAGNKRTDSLQPQYNEVSLGLQFTI